MMSYEQDSSLHLGDQRCVAGLQAEDFRGPRWERLAQQLAAYGFQVMTAWIESGQVFHCMQEKRKKLRLRPPSDGRVLTEEVAEELAVETVGRAVQAFRSVLRREGWAATGGATLSAFFIGQCLFAFPSVYRRWQGETRPTPWKALQVHDELTEAAYRYAQSLPPNPPDRVIARLELEAVLHQMDQRACFVASRNQVGYTLAEIAEMLGMTRKSVKRLIEHHKRQAPVGGTHESAAP